MKRLALILLLLLSTFSFSQSRYSITLSPGVFFPNSTSFKLGIGGLVTFNYNLNNDFTVALTSGYSAWGYRNTNDYNTRVIPIILGVKYDLLESTVIPYLSGEFQFITGEIDYLNYYDSETGLPTTNPTEVTRSIFDYGVGLGAGLKLPINNSLGLDLASSILLTAKNSNIYNIRTTVGLSYYF